MKNYIEIVAIPHEELPQYNIMSLIMKALHGILINYKGEVGLSFPEYYKDIVKIGGKIRCFGSEEHLLDLKEKLLVSKAADYSLISDILVVPEKIKGYCTYSRIRNKSQSKLRRLEKRMKERGINDTQALHSMKKRVEEEKSTSYPHIHLKSSSNGHQYLLVIRELKKRTHSTGLFNAYGLSSTATVPWF